MSDLKKRKFGSTNFEVSLLSFGGAGVSGEGGGYGFGDISEDDAISLVRYAYDRGINLFDSAPIYGFGYSEQRLGKALKEVREKVFITSKSGVTWHNNRRVNMTNDPKVTERMLLQSLKDLSSDYIDLYFIHWPDVNVDIRKPMEVLAKYKDKGVIRHIGLCNTTVEDLEKASEVEKIEVVQSEYNLFNRAVEKEILPFCKAQNMAFMSWGTLDKGILTGSYNPRRHYDESDCRRKAPWFKNSEVERKVELVDRAKKYAEGASFRDMAVAFCLEHATTVLSGPKSKKQLDELLSSIAKYEETLKTVNWEELKPVLQEFYE